jgi:hypothetical protein
MRRTILLTAGLMMAAGASLALAGPASAAPKAPAPCCGSGSFHPSNSNLQFLGQSTYQNQTSLNNIGNPQIALGLFGSASNTNSGGILTATQASSQSAQQFGGAGVGYFW